MKKNITKEEEKALLEIAKRLMAAVDSRGDLEARDNDSEDFIEVPVWGIQKAMEEAYLLEDAEDMVEDQIRMDKDAGREPLAYAPQFFYDTIVELMEQDAE